jgi:type IV pilus assembly protein PilA
MKQSMQKGFTLIELMIVVAIIGILAAVALPAYQDYTVRAKVSEVILAADPTKVAVAEYYQVNNTMPFGGSVSASTQVSDYVASVAYANTSSTTTGKITVTTSTKDSNISSKQLDFTGTGASNGVVTWVCASGSTNGITAKYLPASCK